MDNVQKHTPVHVDELGDTYLINFTRGNKLFEVTNHLGNVMLTVTDKREPVPVAGNPSVIASYKADVVSAADYSPFGMTLPGRVTNNHWQKYRYGFNGKESDSEVNGPYNELDYGMRVYEPRLGRFFSVDPITKDYPFLTPYQYASNRPIDGVDLDGLEYVPTIPTFEKSGDIFDYAKAVDNGVINLLNLPMVMWNSTVKSVEELRKGTWTKTTSSEIKQMGEGVKATAIQFYHSPITTLTSPDAIEFYTEAFIGGKIFSVAPKVKTIIKPTNAGTVEETIPLYRGVNKHHVDFENQSKGIVKPNGGTATPLEHNTVSTLNSPYTSWTTNPEVALNYALRYGKTQTEGVILKVNVKLSDAVKSPDLKRIQLIQKPNVVVSESEVLLRGKIKTQNIQKVNPQN